jgi:hypothetical protein
MTEGIPQKVKSFIDGYFKIPLRGKLVRCPYFINIKKYKQRMGLRVLTGKGNPEEIQRESLIYEKLRGVNFANMSEKEIREFLTKRRIGIDCSGFVVHVLDFWLRTQRKKHLWSYLKFPKQSPYRWIARHLRPIENITAGLLTGDLNTAEVKDLNNIKPGDLVRSRLPKRAENLADRNHVILIYEVEKEDGKVRLFKYVHSTRGYAKEHGVRKGEVKITDPKANLCKQEWSDVYDGRNWTKEEICSDPEYSQVRRLINVPLN